MLSTFRQETQAPNRNLEDAILHLAGHCDGAATRDKKGFNGVDYRFGHQLANQIEAKQPLSRLEAQKALKMVQKYKNTQLSHIKLPKWDEIAHQYKEKQIEKKIDLIEGEIALFSPFDPTGETQKKAREISESYFNKEDKSWRFPLEESTKVVEIFPYPEYRLSKVIEYYLLSQEGLLERYLDWSSDQDYSHLGYSCY